LRDHGGDSMSHAPEHALSDRPGLDDDRGDAHAEQELAVRRENPVSLGHGLLQGDRATHGFYGAGELRKQPVADRLHDAAAMPLDGWTNDVAQECPQLLVGALLVALHEAAIAHDIRCDDCCNPPLGAGGSAGRIVFVGHRSEV